MEYERFQSSQIVVLRKKDDLSLTNIIPKLHTLGKLRINKTDSNKYIATIEDVVIKLKNLDGFSQYVSCGNNVSEAILGLYDAYTSTNAVYKLIGGGMSHKYLFNKDKVFVKLDGTYQLSKYL